MTGAQGNRVMRAHKGYPISKLSHPNYALGTKRAKASVNQRDRSEKSKDPALRAGPY